MASFECWFPRVYYTEGEIYGVWDWKCSNQKPRARVLTSRVTLNCGQEVILCELERYLAKLILVPGWCYTFSSHYDRLGCFLLFVEFRCVRNLDWPDHKDLRQFFANHTEKRGKKWSFYKLNFSLIHFKNIHIFKNARQIWK